MPFVRTFLVADFELELELEHEFVVAVVGQF
jgi:hypothetical protein